MGLQKFRADVAQEPDKNGAVAWYAQWMGGRELAKVANCPVKDAQFAPRMVYATGEPDTWFSVPAACKVRGRTVRGFLTRDDDRGWLFHPHDLPPVVRDIINS